ncbi:hypothetical protein [Streptacidiphilus sp. MAP12-33]|uniref:hypothetical protein n=1 Tax=Streptacidiphilus sp. MAP12-33 TaxID=3156266 RepID=UPI003514737A
MNTTSGRWRRARTRGGAILCWLVGALFAFGGVLGSVLAIHLDATGTRTTAVIVDQRQNGRNEDYLLGFTLPDGTPVDAWTGAIDGGDNGTRVQVLYDPSDPTGTVDSPGHNTTQEWVPLLVAVAAGLGLGWTGRALWLSARAHRNSEPFGDRGLPPIPSRNARSHG